MQGISWLIFFSSLHICKCEHVCTYTHTYCIPATVLKADVSRGESLLCNPIPSLQAHTTSLKLLSSHLSAFFSFCWILGTFPFVLGTCDAGHPTPLCNSLMPALTSMAVTTPGHSPASGLSMTLAIVSYLFCAAAPESSVLRAPLSKLFIQIGLLLVFQRKLYSLLLQVFSVSAFLFLQHIPLDFMLLYTLLYTLYLDYSYSSLRFQFSSGQCGSVGWMSSLYRSRVWFPVKVHPQVCSFDPWLGPIWEAVYWYFSHTSILLSFSSFSSLSKKKK